MKFLLTLYMCTSIGNNCLPITQDMIKNYPHRTTFGSDEIFLTIMIGDKLNKNIWQQSNDMQPRWYSYFVRDHVIK